MSPRLQRNAPGRANANIHVVYVCISEPLQGATMDKNDLAGESISGCVDTFIVAKANAKARKAGANESPGLN